MRKALAQTNGLSVGEIAFSGREDAMVFIVDVQYGERLWMYVDAILSRALIGENLSGRGRRIGS
jgi:hypothetical protein